MIHCEERMRRNQKWFLNDKFRQKVIYNYVVDGLSPTTIFIVVIILLLMIFLSMTYCVSEQNLIRTKFIRTADNFTPR